MPDILYATISAAGYVDLYAANFRPNLMMAIVSGVAKTAP